MKNGSAFYSPAASAIKMAEAYLYDSKTVMAAAAKCTGQYGLKDLYIGVPVIIGSNGIEKILEIDLKDDEIKALQTSAEAVRSIVEIL